MSDNEARGIRHPILAQAEVLAAKAREEKAKAEYELARRTPGAGVIGSHAAHIHKPEKPFTKKNSQPKSDDPGINKYEMLPDSELYPLAEKRLKGEYSPDLARGDLILKLLVEDKG